MLRYKNSLLERILLEKGTVHELHVAAMNERLIFLGIDVQAELQLKTGNPILPPGYLPPGMSQPQQQAPHPPLQRTAVQRQHARRSGGQAFLPKLAPGQPSQDMSYTNTSPQGHPTPSSHASSPTNLTRSPMTAQQGGMTPPTSAGLAQGQAQQYQPYPRPSQPPNPGYYQIPHQSSPETQRQTLPPSRYQSSTSHSNSSQSTMNAANHMGPNQGGFGVNAAGYYPSPFQKHIDQLGMSPRSPQIELCSS